jgi:hypothetical protein
MDEYLGENYPHEYGISSETNELYYIERSRTAETRVSELEQENAQIIELSDLIKTKADEYKARNAELELALNRLLAFVYTFDMGGDLYMENFPAIKLAKKVLGKDG